MKRNKSTITLAVLGALVVLAAGCAKKNSSTGPDAGGVPPMSDDRSASGFDILATGGAWVGFSPTSTAEFSNYVATHPLNAPTNFKLNVNMSNIGNGRFGGRMIIAYNDNGQTYYGDFTTGSGTAQNTYQGRDNGKPTAEFNQWFTYNGKSSFHAFFQDTWGAVMLVVDDGLSLGDGGGVTNLSGRVYYKNFNVTQASQSPEKCWFIRIGPYDCRTFLNSNGDIATTSALYPSNGYRFLGTFSGMDRYQGFNQ